MGGICIPAPLNCYLLNVGTGQQSHVFKGLCGGVLGIETRPDGRNPGQTRVGLFAAMREKGIDQNHSHSQKNAGSDRPVILEPSRHQIRHSAHIEGFYSNRCTGISVHSYFYMKPHKESGLLVQNIDCLSSCFRKNRNDIDRLIR